MPPSPDSPILPEGRILIVNADDYARSPGISRGIRESHLRGIVTTTTVMMNFPDAAAEIERAISECPRLGLGVHVVLTSGRPLSNPAEVPSLVDSSGSFWQQHAFLEKAAAFPLDELEREIRAQISLFQATGAMLDHLDSHHHATYAHPRICELFLDLASELGAPVRNPLAVDRPLPPTWFESINAVIASRNGVRLPSRFFASFYDDGATLEHLHSILSSLPVGVSELMCHPGFVEPEVGLQTSYSAQRSIELELLTGEVARVATKNLSLCTFREAFDR